jgi:hypothetical protein
MTNSAPSFVPEGEADAPSKPYGSSAATDPSLYTDTRAKHIQHLYLVQSIIYSSFVCKGGMQYEPEDASSASLLRPSGHRRLTYARQRNRSESYVLRAP